MYLDTDLGPGRRLSPQPSPTLRNVAQTESKITIRVRWSYADIVTEIPTEGHASTILAQAILVRAVQFVGSKENVIAQTVIFKSDRVTPQLPETPRIVLGQSI